MAMQKRYEAAKGLLPEYTKDKVLNGCPAICWTEHGTFTYQRQLRTEQGVQEVTVEVDARSGEELCDDRLSASEPNEVNPAYEIFQSDHNLYIKDNHTGTVRQLTEDGEAWCEYGCYIDIYSQISVQKQGYQHQPKVLWSPDGRYFVTYRADRRRVKHLYLLESFVDSPEEIRPKLWEYPCPFVMDSDEEMPEFALYIGDAKAGMMTRVDAPAYTDPVFTSPEKSFVCWLPDSQSFYFTWFDRGYQNGRLYLADAKTGQTRLLAEEQAKTFLNLGAFGQLDGFGAYQFSNFVTSDRGLAFWQSEQNGYAQLYRYNLETGLCEGNLFGKNQTTLIVQKLIRVDEEQKQIYFMANNVPDCSDPLYYQLYRVGFDGSSLTRLTPEDAVHQISMGKESFVDTYSRVDLPPVTVLRTLDGTLIRELEQADITELLKAGYQIPERFTVLADDGVTQLYGIMVRPAACGEAHDAKSASAHTQDKLVPLIDYIYGGAQLYNVPRAFTWDNAMNREVMGGLQEFAQLGIAGVILDGRGTPGRGLAFHNFSYRRLHGCAGLKDHADTLPQLKEQFPFLDLDRVGIWGNSGGGYATVSALLQYPELYRAGVASAGNYDQRMYENSWTERYNGRYEEELYRLGDITRLADRLEGSLFLACGSMDDNVSMSQTLRLCDELIRHNKDYELLILPRVNHNVPSDRYFIRRKLDFFVRQLLGEEPPKNFAL